MAEPDPDPTARDPGADADGGTAALLEALHVRRNARRGFGAGLVFTAAVFVFFVVLPGSVHSPLYYVALAFVLAVGLGGLATAALTVASAYRLSREL